MARLHDILRCWGPADPRYILKRRSSLTKLRMGLSRDRPLNLKIYQCLAWQRFSFINFSVWGVKGVSSLTVGLLLNKQRIWMYVNSVYVLWFHHRPYGMFLSLRIKFKHNLDIGDWIASSIAVVCLRADLWASFIHPSPCEQSELSPENSAMARLRDILRGWG